MDNASFIRLSLQELVKMDMIVEDISYIIQYHLITLKALHVAQEVYTHLVSSYGISIDQRCGYSYLLPFVKYLAVPTVDIYNIHFKSPEGRDLVYINVEEYPSSGPRVYYLMTIISKHTFLQIFIQLCLQYPQIYKYGVIISMLNCGICDKYARYLSKI